MTASELPYNYPVFKRETVLPQLRFDQSPPLGRPAPDFELWQLDGAATSLAA
jgi:hypothetical protein